MSTTHFFGRGVIGSMLDMKSRSCKVKLDSGVPRGREFIVDNNFWNLILSGKFEDGKN